MLAIRRRHYPKHWRELSLECKERAGWLCEGCHVPHGTLRESLRTGNLYVVYLHAAHIWHDRTNPQPELRCLCPSCHARYDARHRAREHRIKIERIKHRKALQARGIYLFAVPLVFEHLKRGMI